MICPNCGNQIGNNVKYCIRCGGAIEAAGTKKKDSVNNDELKAQDSRQSIRCHNCGNKIPEGKKVCSACETKQDDTINGKKSPAKKNRFFQILLLLLVMGIFVMGGFLYWVVTGPLREAQQIISKVEDQDMEITTTQDDSEEETEETDAATEAEESGTEAESQTEKKDETEENETSPPSEIDDEYTSNNEIDFQEEPGSEYVSVVNGIQALASDFIFPFSSERLITDEEMNKLFTAGSDTMDKKIYSQRAINEILARYGFVFKEETQIITDAYEYFDAKEWYLEIKGECEYTDSYTFITHMNSIEKANIFRICAWQNAYAVTEQELLIAGENEF